MKRLEEEIFLAEGFDTSTSIKLGFGLPMETSFAIMPTRKTLFCNNHMLAKAGDSILLK